MIRKSNRKVGNAEEVFLVTTVFIFCYGFKAIFNNKFHNYIGFSAATIKTSFVKK